ncbi:hypothetical protein QIA34_01320 [Borreliella yangtzensis]|uniref:Uncharacterized protein n=1 Tax=Borreliella yangtzensis TaxID=683292 RepID=A0ABR6PBG5_9SPIR|nr:hypothetical protein [Borreliella yangtzensis]MBB6043089.1 hypothetical protein [Borreliella yangtzensis]WKC73145.1 hypothetical protein QIA35_01325 [Borreliella yangtzensis]WKC74062.1 hypothetical protein QIA34_01320 [Borreliella yangtzensis]
MKKINCNQQLEIKYQKKLKKHLIVGIIFVIILLFFKILLIPKIQNYENNKNNIKMVISYKQNKDKLSIKINIQTQKNSSLGKAKLDIYLDNKLIERNMLYINSKNFTTYANVIYQNESLLSIILNSNGNNNVFYSKKIKTRG